MWRNKGISIFYVQCVFIGIVFVFVVGAYLYGNSRDVAERMPLYFPRTSSSTHLNDDANRYVPEFRIIPHMTISWLFFRTRTTFMLKKVLQELLLGPHSIYMKHLIPAEAQVRGLLIGKNRDDSKHTIFLQIGVANNAIIHNIEKIQQWLQYNINIHFPSYVIEVYQVEV